MYCGLCMPFPLLGSYLLVGLYLLYFPLTFFSCTGYTSSLLVSSDVSSLHSTHHPSCSHPYSISKPTHYPPFHSTYSYPLLLLRIFFLYINNPELGLWKPTRPPQFQLQRSCARGPRKTRKETAKTASETTGRLKG